MHPARFVRPGSGQLCSVVLWSATGVGTRVRPTAPPSREQQKLVRAAAPKVTGMSSAAVRPGPSNPKPMTTVPLSAVVTEAVRRWYLETHKEAVKGDVKMQALLGQMLIDGYGCEADPAAGKEWVDKARRRGYRMSGTYDEL